MQTLTSITRIFGIATICICIAPLLPAVALMHIVAKLSDQPEQDAELKLQRSKTGKIGVAATHSNINASRLTIA